eukprot:tig00000262_g23062.t1
MAIATPRWNIDLANPGDAVYVGRADTVLVRVLRDQGFADRRILAVFALYGRALVGGGNDGFRKTALSIEGLTVTGKTLAVNCLTTVAKLLLPGGADAVVDVGEKEMKNRKFAQWTTTRCETARALVVREEPLFSTARLGRIWDGVTKTLVVVSNRGLAFQRAAAAAAAYEHRFLRIRRARWHKINACSSSPIAVELPAVHVHPGGHRAPEDLLTSSRIDAYLAQALVSVCERVAQLELELQHAHAQQTLSSGSAGADRDPPTHAPASEASGEPKGADPEVPPKEADATASTSVASASSAHAGDCKLKAAASSDPDRAGPGSSAWKGKAPGDEDELEGGLEGAAAGEDSKVDPESLPAYEMGLSAGVDIALVGRRLDGNAEARAELLERVQQLGRDRIRAIMLVAAAVLGAYEKYRDQHGNNRKLWGTGGRRTSKASTIPSSVRDREEAVGFRLELPAQRTEIYTDLRNLAETIRRFPGLARVTGTGISAIDFVSTVPLLRTADAEGAKRVSARILDAVRSAEATRLTKPCWRSPRGETKTTTRGGGGGERGDEASEAGSASGSGAGDARANNYIS